MRAMFDETGKPVDRGRPVDAGAGARPVGAPNAGDDLLVVESERKAREVALYRQGKFRDVQAREAGRRRCEDVFSQMGEAEAGSDAARASRRTCRAAPRRCATR